MNSICPCGSGKSYQKCCKFFHDGLLPENALELMRSRYAAYVLNLPDYIMHTTHLKNPQYSKDTVLWRKEISEFSKHTKFESLEILDFEEHGNMATVTFVVHLVQNNKPFSFTEKSVFEKVKKRWLYRDAEIESLPKDDASSETP